jgi:hypothetical protein
MKITNKTLMVGFETEVKLGTNNAIELTLMHQAFIYEQKNGGVGVDLDLSIDVTNVKFLGVEIENNYDSYRDFKANLSGLGIDLDKLIDEKEQELIKEGLVDKLKLMFTGKF